MDETAKNLLLTIGVMIGFFCIAGLFISDDPKCAEYGCESDVKTGSNYCYYHSKSSSWRSTGSSKSSGASKSSSASKTNGSYNSSTYKTSTSSKSNPYKSYDEGYEDVYENDDYDWDRYYSDDDYADGVDDAMDELDW